MTRPTFNRLWHVADAFRLGISIDEIHRLTAIDPWFLEQIQEVIAIEEQVKLGHGTPLDPEVLRTAKQARAFPTGGSRTCSDARKDEVRAWREQAGRPSGLQARRHLRRRVRGAHRLHVLHLRAGVRGGPDRAEEGHHPRRRAQPHRPGHRVRLLLRARRRWRCGRSATRPSWSTATRRPCRPTTTPPTACTSSR
ncbi:MAG: hypothetical protein MPW13_02440 [Candidatus Manganitrophus sp.]|nr:hypothetical protein [Candidatus Manganitrophus sp.]